jgi:hypothetical protein
MFGTAGDGARPDVSNLEQNRLPQPVIMNTSESRYAAFLRDFKPLIPGRQFPSHGRKQDRWNPFFFPSGVASADG